MRPITRIQYSPHFVRAMKSLPSDLAEAVELAVALFRSDCTASALRTHKLQGDRKDTWSFSVTRKHRIVFRFFASDQVEFIDVGDHSIYR